MNKDKLRKYLDDFYSGATTPQQENMLREYFQSTYNIDEEFRADAAIFQAIARATLVPADLETRILNATVRRRAKMPKLYKWWSVAAAVAVIATLIGVSQTTSPYHEVSDPYEATEIAMQVSQKLQKNVSKLELLNHMNL